MQQLSTGVLRQRGDHCLQPRRQHLELQPLLAELGPGDRLRISLAGAAWPQIAVNPGDGSIPDGPAGPYHRVITLTPQLQTAELALEALVAGGSAQLGQTGPT